MATRQVRLGHRQGDRDPDGGRTDWRGLQEMTARRPQLPSRAPGQLERSQRRSGPSSREAELPWAPGVSGHHGKPRALLQALLGTVHRLGWAEQLSFPGAVPTPAQGPGVGGVSIR